MKLEKLTNCIDCNTPLTGKQIKFCSNKCKVRNSGNCYENQKQRALNRKIQLIKLCGGKCFVCNYNKNIAGLCFHHLDPNEKEISLDSRKLSNSTMEKLLSEVSKCILLCHTCHMEIHYPHLNNLL